MNRVLINHDEIMEWAEERGAKPSQVASTSDNDATGIIRLDFPGYTGEGSLEEIEWDQWFEKFDESDLALVVQDTTADGARSNFNKLVKRESVRDQISEQRASDPGEAAETSPRSPRKKSGARSGAGS